MPLYSADALVLRTYKLGEADRIVVFLTRDRGKKRGVAPSARRPRSRFTGALEPLTEVRCRRHGRDQQGDGGTGRHTRTHGPSGDAITRPP